jgi:hypothetical protein
MAPQPNDLLKQSIPFSYLSVSVASNDGKPHAVQVYSDISAEWISGDVAAGANWSTTATGNVIMHQVQLSSPQVYGEEKDQTQCELPCTKMSGSILIAYTQMVQHTTVRTSPATRPTSLAETTPSAASSSRTACSRMPKTATSAPCSVIRLMHERHAE